MRKVEDPDQWVLGFIDGWHCAKEEDGKWETTYQTAGSDSSGEPVTATLARSCHAERQNEQRR